MVETSKKGILIVGNFLKIHLGFILTILVTYALGVLLIVAQSVSPHNNLDFMELFLNSIVPTTITYVLGCVLVNIVELLRDKSEFYLFNIFTCFAVMFYAIVFCIYVMVGFSWWWALVEFVLTGGLLCLNVMSYNERYKHRNHGLT